MKKLKLIEVVLITLTIICGGAFAMAVFASVLGWREASLTCGIVFTIAFLAVCILGCVVECNEISTIKTGRRAK